MDNNNVVAVLTQPVVGICTECWNLVDARDTVVVKRVIADPVVEFGAGVYTLRA